MLRDLVLVACILICLGLSLRNPIAGVLAWTWLTLMQPHREVYGFFSSTLRLNLTVAVVTILTWFFSKERKLPPLDGTIVAVLIFLLWMTFNSIFAVVPDDSWDLWDRNWRIVTLGLMISATVNNKIRIHALIWVIVLSLLYYGVKGGFLAIMYGGLKTIDGPPGTLIGDNNHLAVALLMTLPLVNYLRLHTASRMLHLGLIAGFAMTFLAIVSSYSRGAFLALGVLALVALVRSRNKFLYIIIAAAIAFPVFHFMPDAYYNRLSTLNDVDADGSFQGRVISWKVAFFYARDHFPFGAGFDGAQGGGVYNYYFPDKITRAAHSIFFQVLGDLGFVGLAIYLVILFRVFFICSKIRKATRNRPELVWARDLATMIQLSMIAFCVGGSALSLAYYDMFFIWAGVLPPLRNLVRQTETREANAPAIGMAAFSSYPIEGKQFASTYPTPGKA